MIKQGERSPQILVVEDDTEFGDILFRALIKEGYRALLAKNGHEGMHLFRRNQVDLVITDILMPEKDGIEMISEIKREYPYVKIIAISGGSNIVSGQEYLESTRIICDIKHTLTKPFMRNTLFSMIDEVLNK